MFRTTTSDAPPTLWTTSEPDEAGAVITVLGEIDIVTAEKFQRCLSMTLMRTERGRVLVDLSRLEFMDSSGLHALLRANRRCAAQGLELRLRRGPPAVQKIFEITRMDAFFDFEPDAA